MQTKAQQERIVGFLSRLGHVLASIPLGGTVCPQSVISGRRSTSRLFAETRGKIDRSATRALVMVESPATSLLPATKPGASIPILTILYTVCAGHVSSKNAALRNLRDAGIRRV